VAVDAADRKALSQRQPPKASRWPRTERRRSRIRAVLERRQPDLTIVCENIHDPHNVSAILRTCDAVGVLCAHAVYTIEEPPSIAFARETSAGAAKWVAVERHESIAGCYESLHREGFTILATAIGPGAKQLYEWDFTAPIAIVLGNEMRGVSAEAVSRADGTIAIPMVGMVQSLNVSVAGAVCLYEAFRQRLVAGRFDEARFGAEELDRLAADWERR
jgi:tRNA (guanosine-2'-O-)-methyltransferase